MKPWIVADMTAHGGTEHWHLSNLPPCLEYLLLMSSISVPRFPAMRHEDSGNRGCIVILGGWGGVEILGQSTGSSTSRDLFELPRPTGKHRSSDSEPFCLVARCPLLGVTDGPRLTRVQVRATRKNPIHRPRRIRLSLHFFLIAQCRPQMDRLVQSSHTRATTFLSLDYDAGWLCERSKYPGRGFFPPSSMSGLPFSCCSSARRLGSNKCVCDTCLGARVTSNPRGPTEITSVDAITRFWPPGLIPSSGFIL
ncbi:hypothetical protein LZ32DRAFT_268361 [Colletotrichum eremochloae]|nr:hypothetical protein LZ32DRAFT_268361 [Colletotrichum eremochloae]